MIHFVHKGMNQIDLICAPVEYMMKYLSIKGSDKFSISSFQIQTFQRIHVTEHHWKLIHQTRSHRNYQTRSHRSHQTRSLRSHQTRRHRSHQTSSHRSHQTRKDRSHHIRIHRSPQIRSHRKATNQES